MPDSSEPPPSQTLLAAAGGAFGGALLGVAAATMLMGDGDNGEQNAANIEPAQQQEVQVATTER